MIKFIFGIGLETSELAHVFGHCVTRLTLPRVDANLLFHQYFQLDWGFGEEVKSHEERGRRQARR